MSETKDAKTSKLNVGDGTGDSVHQRKGRPTVDQVLTQLVEQERVWISFFCHMQEARKISI